MDVAISETDSESDATAWASPYCAAIAPRAPLAPGRWASRQRTAAIVQLPPTNTPTTVVTTRIALHDVTLESGETRVRHDVCDLRQPKQNGVETVFGPRFLAAIPRNSVIAEIEGNAVTVPGDLVVLGAEVAEGDPLPTEADDPRVRDSDGDGAPGVSVTLQGLFAGQLFVCSRQQLTLTGTADAAGCISGTISGANEQSQLGANPPELAAFELQQQPHPDASLSDFLIVPLDGADAALDCAGLLADEARFFEPENE
jgi:hypothetical protein